MSVCDQHPYRDDEELPSKEENRTAIMENIFQMVVADVMALEMGDRMDPILPAVK